MTALKIPPLLQHSYLTGTPPPAITTFRDWQISLVSHPEFQSGRSVIVVVPTSGGKTVAAEVAIASLLECDPSAKAIYALPFVALASEKFTDFRKRFSQCSVRAFYQNVGGSDMRRGQIAVCTYEKAHVIINAAISGWYSDKLKLVVIDEIHMLGDDHRGAVIEALVVKSLLLRPPVRIIGLTATVNRADADRLSDWIGGFTFSSHTRPSPVSQFLMTPEGDLHILKDGRRGALVLTAKDEPGDVCHIMEPIRQIVSRSSDEMVLIFVNTRLETIKTADFISTRLSSTSNVLAPPPERVEARRRLVQDIARAAGVIDPAVRRCLLNGVAIHHAGLLLEERKLIEAAARSKTLSVLVATTTLSAGVNIHAVRRVLIMNIYRTATPPHDPVRIAASQFTQMVGRAGRTEGRAGDAIVFAHMRHPSEVAEIEALSAHAIPDISPHLREEGQLERFYLQALSVGLVGPGTGVGDFIRRTLRPDADADADAEGRATRYLAERGLVGADLCATALGRAIAGSSLTIEEGLQMADVVVRMQTDLCLDDEVHLLYLCVSVRYGSAYARSTGT
jgi:replicative superfamily II helicase